MMPNGDPPDRFFYPTCILTLIIYSNILPPVPVAAVSVVVYSLFFLNLAIEFFSFNHLIQ